MQDILKDRLTTHGDFKDQSRVVQNLKAMVYNCEGSKNLSSMHREALDMILHKISRIVTGDPNFYDHWVDIAGYAKITSDLLPSFPDHPAS